MFQFLALGDSYTIGESVREMDRWPNQLSQVLGELGHSVVVTSLAQTGWTTGELLKAMADFPFQEHYDLVSLLIGVNNQYRGLDLHQFQEEFTSLLEKSRHLTGGRPERTLVLSIPDWSVTPFARDRDRRKISGEIDEFNAACSKIALRQGSAFFDVTPISRLASQETALLAEDGLHPSAEQYRRWVDLILPTVWTKLQNP